MKQIFSIKDISTYRSELMGIAMIWIMMIHFDFTQIKPLGFVSQFGFLGPDIFLFVSGFGLFFSLDKNHVIQNYLKKRIIRIFPTYYLLGIIPSVIYYNDSIIEYLFRYTTIGFWTNNIYGEWYIPSAIMLYLWAPIIKIAFDKKWYSIISLFTIIIICFAFFLVDKDTIIDRPHFSFLHRIPSFIFGMTCAFMIKEGLSVKLYYFIIILGIPIFAYLYPQHHQIYNYKNFSLTYLLPAVIALFCIILNTIKKAKLLTSILSEIGKASLETYLIQGLFFHAINIKAIVVPPLWHDTVTISLIIVSSLLGIMTHWLINKSGILRLL